MSYQFKIPADAADLRKAADHVDDLAELFRVKGQQISGSPDVFAADSWSGQTRDRVCAELQGLGGRMSTLPSPLRTVAKQIRATATIVERVQSDVFQLNKSYEVAEAKEFTSGNRRSAGLRGARDDAERHEIEVTYEKNLTDARSAMRGLSNQFEDKRMEVQQAFIELGRVLAQETIVNVPESAISAFQAGGGSGADLWRYPRPEGVIPADLGVDDIFAETQPMLAGRTAMEDAETAAKLVPAAASGDIAASKLLQQITKKHRKDPLFSAHFAKTLGANGYAQAAQAMTNRFTSTTAGSAEEKQVSAENELLSACLGSTINDAADTRNDKSLTYQQRTEIKTWRDQVFLPELKKMGRTEYQTDGGDGSYYGYWALGQFIEAGAKNGQPPGPDFMNSVGADAIQWDAESNEPGDVTDQSWASPFGLFASGIDAHRSGFTMSETRAIADPIHGFLSAASYDRQAAQAMFTGEVVSDGKSINRLDYLMKERRQPSKGGAPYEDHGAALGSAVRAADMDRMDKTGTEIASRFMNNYMAGLKDGKNKTMGLSNQNYYSDALGGLRPYIGDVMAYYIDDVNHTIYHGEKPVSRALSDGGEIEYNLQIDNGPQIGKLIADLAADRPGDIANLDADPPNAMQKLLLAQLQHTQQNLIPVANSTHDMSVRGEKLALVLGYIRRSGEIGLEANGKEKDDINKMVQGIAKQGIDLIPQVKAAKGNPIGGVVTGPIVDKSLNKLFPMDNLSKYQGEAPAGERKIDDLYSRAIQEAIRSRTHWKEGTSPEDWLAGAGRVHGPEGKFTDVDGTIIRREDRTEAQEEAFEGWWRGESSFKGDNSESPTLEKESTEITNAANGGLDDGEGRAERDSKG